MYKYFISLNQYIKNRSAVEEHQFILYGIISFTGFISFYFLNIFILKESSENLLLRSGAIILAIGLILKNYWPKKIKKFLPYYWYISLLYGLPFFFTYMLFENTWSIQWQLNKLMSLILLAILTDWVGVIIIGSIGAILGYILYNFTHITVPIPKEFYAIISAYTTILIYIIVFLQKNKWFNSELLRMKDSLNYELELKVIERSQQLETKVIERTAELNKALEAKDYFLRNVNHEIRTPIQVISTISGELKEKWGVIKKEKAQRLLEELSTSTERLFSLVTNVLDLSKFDAGKMLFNIEKADLIESLEKVLGEVKSLARDKKIKISVINKAKNTITLFDKERIQQVIRNILSNAIKYSPKNSDISIELDEQMMAIKNAQQARALKVIIRDRGVGIPESELFSIFEPFVQSTKTDTNAGGTGLGLSIAAEIIYTHGGRIWAQNNENESGSTFFFMLPLVEDAEILNIEKVVDQKNKEIKVLFVDDELGCRGMAEMILSKEAGFNLKTCSSGQEALEFLNNNHANIDVILLDMMMPGMNGTEVLKEIKSNKKYSNIPVLLQTGLKSDLELSKAMSLGANTHIAKPYNKEQLRAVVKKLIHKQ